MASEGVMGSGCLSLLDSQHSFPTAPWRKKGNGFFKCPKISKKILRAFATVFLALSPAQALMTAALPPHFQAALSGTSTLCGERKESKMQRNSPALQDSSSTLAPSKSASWPTPTTSRSQPPQRLSWKSSRSQEVETAGNRKPMESSHIHTVQRGKLRPREGQELAQGYTANQPPSNWPSQVSKPSSARYPFYP